LLNRGLLPGCFASDNFLAAGCWLLAAGCWLLAAGCWLLAAGCLGIMSPDNLLRQILKKLLQGHSILHLFECYWVEFL
jgi:hypothetical protein